MNQRDTMASRVVLLPAGSLPARWIVCERRGTWAVRMRRELPSGTLRLDETRSLAEAWQRLAQAPASFVVAELTSQNVESLSGRLVRLRWDFPLAQGAVVASRDLAAYEPLMREAGAVMFVDSPRRLAPLVAAACRHLAAAPVFQTTLKEQIWAELPWGQGARGEGLGTRD
jgi:hypothetical protein